MANIDRPTFGGVTMPFPSDTNIEPSWIFGEVTTLGGKTRRDVMARKYKYTLKWSYIKVSDYDALETIINGLVATTFIYGKWPQSVSPGVSCLGNLSARKLKHGVGDSNYWSDVTLILIEVNSRI